MVVSLIGGIGLFLLGMILLGDGLKSFAGDSLRKALLRYTGRPFAAFASGALVTALVQSSSATTLATIGFVSAGLLGFGQSVGLVMGASLGTTSTGWLVSLFGLKFSISAFALPLIGVGTFIKLLSRGRAAPLGMALAGFGLIFIGIDQLQAGMAGLTQHVDLTALPSEGFAADLLMMGVGIALTVVMQSSSAAVATTLAALHADAITFEQSASLVIGAAIGTTVTAALASIGASVAAKRTALAHILFNLFTGLVALGLLPVFLRGLEFAGEHLGLDRGAVSLAAFHTSFIALGVVIFLPFVGVFSRLIEWILPEKGPRLTRHLDPSLLAVPAVAMEAARGCLRETATLLFRILEQRLGNAPVDRRTEEAVEQIAVALRETSEFITKIPDVEHQPAGSHRRRDAFHAIDHLTQLLPCASQRHLPIVHSPLVDAAGDCRAALELASQHLGDPAAREDTLPEPEELAKTSAALAEWRKHERIRLLENTAASGGAARTLHLLDTIRWIDRIAYHSWRISASL